MNGLSIVQKVPNVMPAVVVGIDGGVLAIHGHLPLREAGLAEVAVMLGLEHVGGFVGEPAQQKSQ